MVDPITHVCGVTPLTHLQTGRDVFPEFEPLDVPLILDDVLVCNNFIETNLYSQHLENASQLSTSICKNRKGICHRILNVKVLVEAFNKKKKVLLRLLST